MQTMVQKQTTGAPVGHIHKATDGWARDGDGALIDGLGLVGSGSDLFPDSHPPDSRFFPEPVDAP